MPRRLRVDVGGFVYHVINRRAGRRVLFRDGGDYRAFEKVLAEVCAASPGVRLVTYCLMPNHWHLVLWPTDDRTLSKFMQRLTVTHMRRWHAHRGSAGTGPVYQGRFKSFPAECDHHLLVVCRYVERNAVRAGLAARAADWPWSGAARRAGDRPGWLLPTGDWPVGVPADYGAWVDAPVTDAELAAVRGSVDRGTPFGRPPWRARTADRLGLASSLRGPGRPRNPKRPRPARASGPPTTGNEN